ncbi:SIMPL domain-containing protein [bacterium]|nr:SIMPL domain-containing protein [bacterium]
MTISCFADDRNITVVGNSTLDIPADQITVSFSVFATARSLREAIELASQKVSALATRITNFGVPSEQINTTRFDSGGNYSKPWYTNNKDFRTSISVQVTLNDLTRFEPLLLLLSDNDIIDINDINFSLADEFRHKVDVLTAAVQNARTKAEAVAAKKSSGAKSVLV